MPADPPPSMLITPDLRRRLQQRYDEAQRLWGDARPDFGRIHGLLAECLRADPGNILYLDALLGNLRRCEAARRDKSWPGRWIAGWMQWRRASRPKGIGSAPPSNAVPSTQYSVPSTSYSVLQDAPNLLWNEPANVTILRQLAAAAGDCDFEEVELRYLKAARELAPDDAETLRMLARALSRQGRFDEAVGPWFAVLALAPADAEAEQAIEDLRGASESASSSPALAQAPSQTDAAALVAQARALQNAGDFSAAEALFAQAQAASGSELALLHEREELRLRHSEDRLRIARRRAASDPHPRAQSLVARLEQEHNRLEIDILNMRAERLPEAADVRIELARRLKRAGNYSGAIQRLEEAAQLAPKDPEPQIELGECWQHLRQFEKALGFYQQAADACEPIAPMDDTAKLAHYRLAALAAALGKGELASKHLAAIVASDPEFKDARERLDKLASN